MFIGATFGGVLIAYFGVHVHALLASLLVVLALVLAWPRLLADRPPGQPLITRRRTRAAKIPGPAC